MVGADLRHVAVRQFLRLSNTRPDKWAFSRAPGDTGGDPRHAADFHRVTDALRESFARTRPVRTRGGRTPPAPSARRTSATRVAASNAARCRTQLIDGTWRVNGEIHINDRINAWPFRPVSGWTSADRLFVCSGSPLRCQTDVERMEAIVVPLSLAVALWSLGPRRSSCNSRDVVRSWIICERVPSNVEAE